jgi:hypothetical protein
MPVSFSSCNIVLVFLPQKAINASISDSNGMKGCFGSYLTFIGVHEILKALVNE